MKLRIVAGTHKGRYIVSSSASADDFRPTSEKVRAAVMSMLATRIADATVLDLCAGSGAIGFELLSRGASTVCFAENDSKRVMQLVATAAEFDMSEQVRVERSDARSFVKNSAASQHYSIIYFDPPYNDAALLALVPEIMHICADDGILIVERASRVQPPYEPGTQSRSYGDTTLDIFYKGTR